MENIAFPILTGSGLEVASRRLGGLGVAQAPETFLNVKCGHAVIDPADSEAIARLVQRALFSAWFKRLRIIAARCATTSASAVRSSLRNTAA